MKLLDLFSERSVHNVLYPPSFAKIRTEKDFRLDWAYIQGKGKLHFNVRGFNLIQLLVTKKNTSALSANFSQLAVAIEKLLLKLQGTEKSKNE